MADDQYVAVVSLDTAMHALGTMIETRRGYLKLIEQMIAPYPLQHQFDQSKRNQMVTLLSRADTLWVLLLVHSESKHAARPAASAARAAREKLLGAHLTRATIARGLAIVETGNPDAVTERRHTVAASRLVEAGTLLPPLGSLKPASLTVCLKWVSNQMLNSYRLWGRRNLQVFYTRSAITHIG